MQHLQVVIEFHGIIFSIVAAIYLLGKRYQRREVVKSLQMVILVCIFMMWCDIHAIIYHGVTTDIGWKMTFWTNMGVYLFQLFILVGMGRYIKFLLDLYIEDQNIAWLHIIYGIALIDMLGLAITPFTGFYYYMDDANVYHRGEYFFFSVLFACLILIIEFIVVVRARRLLKKQEIITLLTCFSFPIIGLVIQMLRYGISFMNIGMTISVLILIIQFAYRDRKLQREQEQKLAQSRAYLLNSQIKPHFIFNCLSVIQSLIELDPDAAREAIDIFSKYMRKNLNLKVSESAIPVEEELDFTDSYLYMEQLRFGDQLDVEYDIDNSLKFNIPFLSIQPVVENAIRHGIRKKMTPGTVTIRIYAKDRWNVIEVIDDGIGFDPKNPKKDKLDHQSNGVGIKNVEERIHLLCNGDMNVESTIGVGTTVRIRIPR